jgi:hypothetical protein
MGRVDKITGAATATRQNTPPTRMAMVKAGHTATAGDHMTTPEIARTIIDVTARLHRAIGGHHSSHLNKTDIRNEHHAIVRMERDHSSAATISVGLQTAREDTGQTPLVHMKTVHQEKMLLAPHMRSILRVITNILVINKMGAIMHPALRRGHSVVNITIAMNRTNQRENGM